jgi:EAL domain-containing protein (putative c-di-GMP-specific phosphodiesterase class I)
LARWRHPERGLIPPIDFIPVAEQTGLIIPLGEHMLRVVCGQIKAWQNAKLTVPTVSVNVSGRQIDAGGLDHLVIAILEESGISPSCLSLELTESSIIEDTEATSRMMHRLRDIGVTFSVDDFGIEHSSLGLISRLPIDTIKIDRLFISRMMTAPAHTALVQAMVSMSHAMRKKVIAEGVETHDEFTILRAFQCDALQGYIFSKPLPHAELAVILAHGRMLPAGQT